jgi:hypothetical protein
MNNNLGCKERCIIIVKKNRCCRRWSTTICALIGPRSAWAAVGGSHCYCGLVLFPPCPASIPARSLSILCHGTSLSWTYRRPPAQERQRHPGTAILRPWQVGVVGRGVNWSTPGTVFPWDFAGFGSDGGEDTRQVAASARLLLTV